MEKAAALAAGGRHAARAVHAAGWAWVLVPIGLEHARLGWQQLRIEPSQTIELGLTGWAGARAGIPRTGLRDLARHGRMMPMRGARGVRGVRRGAAAIGIRGAAGMRAGIFGMPPAFGIFGPGIFGVFDPPLAITSCCLSSRSPQCLGISRPPCV